MSISISIFLKNLLNFYCSTIFCYFPKATLQKIYNIYNYTIFKLLNLKVTVDANNFKKLVENYGLNNFQHRLFIRMATFLHNIVNIEQAPKLLKDKMIQPLRIHNHYGEATFVYFYSKFLNNFILEGLKNNFI